VTRRDRLNAGIIAGAVGGLLVVLFLFMLQLDSAAPTPAAFFTFAAVALLGPSAYAYPAAAVLGVVLIFVLAIGWALGYVHLARSQRQLVTRPFVSGAAFGLVVYTVSQIALLATGLYRSLGPVQLWEVLAGNLLFYGIPVALIVSSFARARTT
jgi:hypothetical protein